MSALIQTDAAGNLINTFSGPTIDALLDERIPVMWERFANGVGRATFNAWVASGQRFFVLDFPRIGDRTELHAPAAPVVPGAPEDNTWLLIAAGVAVVLLLRRR